MYVILEGLSHISTSAMQTLAISGSRSALQVLGNSSSSHLFLSEIMSLQINFNRQVFLCWVSAHVWMIDNEEADRLTDAAASSVIKTPYPL